MANNNHRHSCQICKKSYSLAHLTPAAMVRPSVADLIRTEHPDWIAEGFVCHTDLNRYRSMHVQSMLEDERGELSHLEKDVVESMREGDLIAENVEREFVAKATLGEQLADRIASFGGSWAFLSIFGCVLIVWMIINSLAILSKPFDPYPFILLNLVLSCLAAVQAPVIMMSQNRQESKDRIRAEHDYRVNLKAEVEIRQLHAKIDMLLTHQWQRLLEIQQMQMDLMQELGKGK
ncbi:MAG: DUF1003 domain-containing protein [Planctomycetales bacterium]|nr:DUF1003 domain-containing protein [Planctomycetales bacterium]